MLEKDIERKSAQWAKRNDWLTYKFTSPAQRGVPDRVFIKGGRVVFIEYKTAKGRTTKLQDLVIAAMRAHGAEVYVCRSVDETKEVLGESN